MTADSTEYTELKRQVQELQERLKKEEERNTKRDLFLSRISRDIRTPLNTMLGLSGMMKENAPQDIRVRDYLSSMEDNSRIIKDVIDDTLDMYQLKNKSVVIEHQIFDLKEQMTEIGLMLYEQAKRKKIHFNIHIKGVTEECVIGDEKHVNQVLVKLLSMAVKHTNPGGKVDLTVIQASTSRDRVHMRFIIQDTGFGFTDETKDKIMKALRADSMDIADGEAGESWLGYCISYRLIQLMNGDIQMESRPGELTRICIDIPFEKTAQAAEPQYQKISDTRCLLIAGNQEINRERGGMLQDMGLSYDSSEDAEEALDMIGEAEDAGNPYKICMIDWDSNAYKAGILTSRIREIFGDDMIIIGTSFCVRQSEEEGWEHGVNYMIDNVVFRSTLFDALMMVEKGEVLLNREDRDFEQYDFTGKRILITEDVPLNMEVVANLISRVHGEFVCAENGLEALRIFKAKPARYFDCIFMDINMPVMDGYEAAERIRSCGKEDALTIPIIAMTANAFTNDVAEAMNHGMNEHIAKPIDVTILYRTLDKLFYGKNVKNTEQELHRKAAALEEQNKQLRERAEHDPLTNLLNRYAFERRMREIMYRKTPIVFMLLDVDHFKSINDQYGHEVGDRILVKVSEALKDAFKKEDYIVRFGGDEFAVIIYHFACNPTLFAEKVYKINEFLSNPKDGLPAVTLSAGAMYSENGYTSELYQQADKALYLTKQSGRRNCTFYRDQNDLEQQPEYRSLLEQYMQYRAEARSDMGDMIPVKVYRLFEYSMKDILRERYGSYQQKVIFREAGYRAGRYLADNMLNMSLNLEDFFAALAAQMEKLRLGIFRLEEIDETGDHMILTVSEDADCSGMSDIGEMICNYDEGMISGILHAYTSKKYNVEEVACYAAGDDLCRFDINKEN